MTTRRRLCRGEAWKKYDEKEKVNQYTDASTQLESIRIMRCDATTPGAVALELARVERRLTVLREAGPSKGEALLSLATAGTFGDGKHRAALKHSNSKFTADGRGSRGEVTWLQRRRDELRAQHQRNCAAVDAPHDVKMTASPRHVNILSAVTGGRFGEGKHRASLTNLAHHTTPHSHPDEGAGEPASMGEDRTLHNSGVRRASLLSKVTHAHFGEGKHRALFAHTVARATTATAPAPAKKRRSKRRAKNATKNATANAVVWAWETEATETARRRKRAQAKHVASLEHTTRLKPVDVAHAAGLDDVYAMLGYRKKAAKRRRAQAVAAAAAARKKTTTKTNATRGDRTLKRPPRARTARTPPEPSRRPEEREPLSPYVPRRAARVNRRKLAQLAEPRKPPSPSSGSNAKTKVKVNRRRLEELAHPRNPPRSPAGDADASRDPNAHCGRTRNVTRAVARGGRVTKRLAELAKPKAAPSERITPLFPPSPPRSARSARHAKRGASGRGGASPHYATSTQAQLSRAKLAQRQCARIELNGAPNIVFGRAGTKRFAAGADADATQRGAGGDVKGEAKGNAGREGGSTSSKASAARLAELSQPIGRLCRSVVIPNDDPAAFGSGSRDPLRSARGTRLVQALQHTDRLHHASNGHPRARRALQTGATPPADAAAAAAGLVVDATMVQLRGVRGWTACALRLARGARALRITKSVLRSHSSDETLRGAALLRRSGPERRICTIVSPELASSGRRNGAREEARALQLRFESPGAALHWVTRVAAAWGLVESVHARGAEWCPPTAIPRWLTHATTHALLRASNVSVRFPADPPGVWSHRRLWLVKDAKADHRQSSVAFAWSHPIKAREATAGLVVAGALHRASIEMVDRETVAEHRSFVFAVVGEVQPLPAGLAASPAHLLSKVTHAHFGEGKHRAQLAHALSWIKAPASASASASASPPVPALAPAAGAGASARALHRGARGAQSAKRISVLIQADNASTLMGWQDAVSRAKHVTAAVPLR